MKRRYYVIIGFFVVFAVFLGKVIHHNHSLRCKYYCSSFRGVVKDIRYSEQKQIKVLIGDRWIVLGGNIKYDIKVEIGDEIRKDSADYSTILIKDGKAFNISSARNTSVLKKHCRCEED